ncbi:chemokine-like protein TAFA-3 isoform X5 [Talpa occidentalis]|uniref:chemokine-like protein TAFA-3 isoform X5 n=1 Tax=Talpa occidentalis TaxID=50954 RepID=UPI00188FBE6D|nr:chemokine-like protein TAFA-3 isoform X5 [Talpa occidentalis]
MGLPWMRERATRSWSRGGWAWALCLVGLWTLLASASLQPPTPTGNSQLCCPTQRRPGETHRSPSLPGEAGRLRGDRCSPLLQPEPHRGALPDRQVLLLFWPGGRHHAGKALLCGCLHRPAEVVVSDGALPAGGGV